MRLEWLEDIIAVHEAGSLRAAADARFLTASAFTRRIKAIEQAIGSELFDRKNKPVTLLPHVIALIPRMREASVNLHGLRNELAVTATGSRITRLVCQHTLSVSWAPKVVSSLIQNNTQLTIRSGSKDECLFSVLKNDADIALVYEQTISGIDQENDLCKRLYLGQEQFLPVAALSKCKELQKAMSGGHMPLVTYPRNIFLGEMLEQALATRPERGISYSVRAEAGLGPAVMEFVREGLGVGWLPESLIQQELDGGEFHLMDEHFPAFELDIVALSSRAHASALIDQVWKTIRTDFG